MILYKLTEQDGTTYHKSMMWEVGKTNKVRKRKNPKLCSGNVIHAYQNANLALLLNPIHADICNPLLFECEGDIAISDWSKCGVFALTPVKKVGLPRWYRSESQRADVFSMFAILSASRVLDGCEMSYFRDASPKIAIEEALRALITAHEQPHADATYAAYVARAAAYAAAHAAYATEHATDHTAWAALATRAAAWVSHATHAPHAAAHADDHATHAAAYAARAAAAHADARPSSIDFCALADEAVRLIMSGDYKTWEIGG